MNIKEINPREANELIKSGAILVDVRENEEVLQKSFSINKVENIPFSIFDDNYSELSHDVKIVLACQIGMRSLRAAQFLIIQGWNEANIFSMEGGIKAWQEAGLPVKSAPRTFAFAKPASSCGCGSGDCC